jgi:type VII secretion integral membrane protein EccD
MTLPLPEPILSLRDLDAEPEPEPELSRVSVVVGGLELDVGLPADANIAALADEVIEFANAAVTTHPDGTNGGFEAGFDATKGKWTLARLGAEPLDPHRPLADFTVCDGEVLVIREVGTPHAPMLFDDLDVDADSSDRPWWAALLHDARMAGCFAVALIASVAASLLLVGLAYHSPSMPAAAAALAAGAAGIIAACILGYRSATSLASPWLAAVAIPLIFAGALDIVPSGVPGASPTSSLPMAFGLTGFAALITLVVSRRGRSFHTAVIALSMFGGAAAISLLLWSPALRMIGAILATTSVIAVYLAPRVTILLSKMPVPPVPTAGEPLDDIEMQGGTTVEGVDAIGKQVVPTEEGVIERVRPSNQYLTGIVAAATLAAVVGSYLANDVSSGFFWQGTAFAITVATVLCLRGRTHYDLVQSATLIGGGLLTGFALIVKTTAHLDGWRVNAALVLVVLMALIVTCGLIAPRLEFSPVMKRQVEILEYVAIALLFPLCFWIIRLYAFFRELRV